MSRFKGMVERLSMVMDRMASIAVVLTMMVIVVNIITRGVFHKPITGIMDYVMILTAVTIALALASCALQNSHIAVDLIIEKLPARICGIIDAVTNFVSMVFWVFTAVYMLDYARNMSITGTVFATTQIPYAPVLGVIAIGIFALAAVLFYRLIDTVRKLVI